MLEQVLRVWRKMPVTPVVRAKTPEKALWITEALLNAGILSIELTATTPGWYEVLSELHKRRNGKLNGENELRYSLGVGTLTDVAQVGQAQMAGADFLVSPCLEPTVLRAAGEAGLFFIPGVLTPSEVFRAVQGFHCPVLKVFPLASMGGASYLRQLNGPFPGWHWLACGGLRVSDIAPCVEAGAIAVGLGAEILPEAAGLVALESEQEAYVNWLQKELAAWLLP